MTTQVYIETQGSGPDLVLLHGWGLNGGVWQGIVPMLAQRFTVHVVDLPGFGHSHQSLPAHFDLASLVSQLLPGLPAQAHWVGWSLGGMVAMHAAAHYPGRVRSLVTVASSPCFVAGDSWPGMKTEVLADFTAALLSDHQKTLNRFIALQAMGSEHAREEILALRDILQSRPAPADRALEGGLAILSRADLRTDIHAIRQPWLRLYGRLDSLVPRHHRKVMDALHPGSRSHLFPRASHAPFLSHKADFLVQVESFLSR